MRLEEFNQASASEASDLLIQICHSHRWVDRMLSDRPFASIGDMHKAAESHWQDMQEADILEAFSGHAKIGDLSALRDKYSTASAEQGQVVQADDSVLHDLMRLNKEYEAKNGFIFIVCATGKSAEEMRDILLGRISGSRDQELAAGAAEQAKITALRIDKMFAND